MAQRTLAGRPPRHSTAPETSRDRVAVGRGDAALGDEPGDQSGRGDVESIVDRARALGRDRDRRRLAVAVAPRDRKHLVGHRAPRSGSHRRTPTRGPASATAARHRTARHCPAPRAPWRRCRSCCRHRHSRRRGRRRRARCRRRRAASAGRRRVGDQRVRQSAPPQLPGGEIGALQARPRLAHPDVQRETLRRARGTSAPSPCPSRRLRARPALQWVITLTGPLLPRAMSRSSASPCAPIA